MLPMPWSPAASWELYTSRFRAISQNVQVRIAAAFWLFGLINNIFYVIILSAALDLVGPDIPKGTVLLASIIPGLATKILVPYILHLIPYGLRIKLLVTLSSCGLLVIAFSPNQKASGLVAKLSGIIVANISSGAGETHFLSLVHFYGSTSLAAWSSGTGGAGLIGAGLYALVTTTFGLDVRTTLIASAFLPIAMLLSYFILLPQMPPQESTLATTTEYASVFGDDEDELDQRETNGLLRQSRQNNNVRDQLRPDQSRSLRVWNSIKHRLDRTRPLLIPYMLPLFLVYAAEYTINQGVSPTLLFDLDRSPFQHYRDFYPAYGAIYQLGVFISRSSLSFVRIRSLYTPSLLQVMNLIILGIHAIHPFLPSAWYVLAIIFWEGLLGGLVYVSTFAAIREEVDAEDREFSLASVTVSDSAGIFLAGLVSVGLERSLCAWQVRHGRDWCKQL